MIASDETRGAYHSTSDDLATFRQDAIKRKPRLSLRFVWSLHAELSLKLASNSHPPAFEIGPAFSCVQKCDLTIKFGLRWKPGNVRQRSNSKLTGFLRKEHKAVNRP